MGRKKVKALIVLLSALLALIFINVFDTNYFQKLVYPEKYWTQRQELMRKSIEHDQMQIKLLSIELSKQGLSENQDQNRNTNIQDKIAFWEGMLLENNRELEKAKNKLIRMTERNDRQ